VRPAQCRFQHGAANRAVTRPVRCTHSAVIHGIRRGPGPAACPACATPVARSPGR
jgi:hypothetical protein